MKQKSPFTVWVEDEAHKHNLSVTTIKNIYKRSNHNKHIRQEMIEAAKKRHYEASPKIKSIIIPSSFILQSLLTYKIHKYMIPDFALFNAEFAYVISNENDYYAEELKINRNEKDYIDFHGLTYDEFILLSALYTAIHDEYNTTSYKTYTSTSISISALWQMLYPSSRWNNAPKKIKAKFFKDILALRNKIKNISAIYWKKGLKESIKTLEDAKFLMQIDFAGDNVDNCFVKASINNNGLLRQAEQQKRIIRISNELYDYGRDFADGSFTNHLIIKLYIAYRIKINSDKMQNSITKKTLMEICGKVDNDYIHRYMKHLIDRGIIAKYTSTRHSITWELPDTKKHSLIIMHDEAGKMSKNPPEETEDIKQRANDLFVINKFFSRYEVKLDKKVINTELHSTYCNNNWMQGGRLYTSAGGYQSLSKEDRSRLTINGKSVVELDYSAYHPNLMYAFTGAKMTGDAYDFWSDRKVAKLALNVVINAKNKSEAIGAIKAKVDKSVDVNALLQAMEKRHSEIAHHFYSGAGILLQNMDAEIAVKIVLKMRAKRILALPVHDSFIVDARFKDKLMQVMLEEYSNYTGGFSINIK